MYTPSPRPHTMPQNAPRYHQALEGGPHQEEVKKLKLKREAARKEFEVSMQPLLSAGAVESLLRCGMWMKIGGQLLLVHVCPSPARTTHDRLASWPLPRSTSQLSPVSSKSPLPKHLTTSQSTVSGVNSVGGWEGGS